MSTNITKSDDDCYFFFNATCTKGDACPFRHSTAAYGSEIVCSFWREGSCIKGNSCKYRHMEIRKSRSKVECFFERQPGGCKKPHCPFLHSSRLQTRPTGEDGDGIDMADLQTTSSEQFNSKSLTDSENKGGDGGDITILTEANSSENYLKPCPTPPFSPNSSTTKLLLPTSPSSTAATIGSEPVSFSIDIAEESENEPEDIGHFEKKSIRLTSNNHNIEANFGIKTLEQIRMEKVFRQNDVNKLTSLEPEHSSTSSKQFRVKLKRRSLSTNNNSNSTSPGNLTTANEDESKITGIKSLDEIRREKKQTLQCSSIKMSADCEKEDDKPKKVIKIKRTHLEINKPPTKIIKINKSPADGNKTTTPVNRCNLSPIKATTSTTKVQQQRRHLRSTSSAPTPTPTPTSSLKLPKQSLKLKLKSPKSMPPPNPISITETVPAKQLEVKPTNVKLQLKKLTISPNKEVTFKSDDGQQNLTNLSNVTTVNSNNQSLQNPSSFHSSQPIQQQQDDYSIIADDDDDDDYNVRDDKYNSDSSLNLSVDKLVDENRISKSSPQPLSQEDGDEDQLEEQVNEYDLIGTMEQVDSLSKNDDDLLEEDDDDDLLADGEAPPDDVAIEDEDDEFLKEIEHVINS